MPDVWSMVSRLDAATQERLADVLETRGADAQQQRMRDAFLADVGFPAGARVLDVGCGTGVLTRRLARRPGVASVVGVDVAPSLLERARSLCSALPGVVFEDGDATALPFDDASFDVLVLDSTLSHVPDAERAVAEAARVLRPNGVLAVFDGDYATTTVALGEHDPLQTCVEAMVNGSVTDRWLMRRLPAIVRGCGFDVTRYASHGYVETDEAEYLLTVIDRGADALGSAGVAGPELVAALKVEAQRRVDAGAFFGQIVYTSLVARPTRRAGPWG
ncbi:methyltransferase domain-containing protein [Pseudonocardia zijingensis]|jgi:ubiquinone/menaquinone biosynthesis C-methylase UbiE|uniref:Class I SAM-dependent methyltransferase n=1 Tax=Pseudonocardia zijingensis TaxID=153376 RepID=A0ABP3ZBK0_9PSEU